MKKKKNFFIIAIIALIIIIGVLITYNLFFKTGLTELTIDKAIEKIENKEDFVLCISQTTCTHCNSYKPKLKEVGKNYDLEIFYIDIDKYEQEEINKFKKYLSFDGSTPVTAFIKNGQETTAGNRIFGAVSYEKIVKKLKSNGFISK